MIVGIGIDLFEIGKIAKDIHSDAYLRKVFTETEIAVCKTSVNSAERLAGRIADKEAFINAISNGIHQGFWFTQIKVLNHENGQPFIQVSGEAQIQMNEWGVKSIQTSLANTKKLLLRSTINEEE